MRVKHKHFATFPQFLNYTFLNSKVKCFYIK
nr:MAG TPA: hypothetical protein [Caudoviricetes sp.]